ncbi:4'-phosphopantetheinyl transferase superfamily protein [Streptomyces sp. NPDC047097]|uniref:4'-phosphopantetheinyl transferase family protein n=1 Tax=Streptomyces sp. NPDC047097 TaxID=3155260 RepID=UPI0033F7AE52
MSLLATGPDLGTGTADLWLLPEHAIPAFTAGLGGERLLTPAERARRARLFSPAARQRFLARRLLCRQALSARTGRPPDAWRFTTGRHGRPEPAPDRDGVRFSLASTRGLVVCAVTTGRACGVDVEPYGLSADSAHHLARFFAPAERRELAALDPAARAARTGELWVLKEAYLKAQGAGLHRSLAEFSFAPRGPSGQGRITVRDPLRPGPWSFDLLDLLHPGARHLVALSVEGDHLAEVRQTWPAGADTPTAPRRREAP